MTEFMFEQPADGLFILAFPASEKYCCDGEWLTVPDLEAIRSEITRILAAEEAKTKAEQHG